MLQKGPLFVADCTGLARARHHDLEKYKTCIEGTHNLVEKICTYIILRLCIGHNSNRDIKSSICLLRSTFPLLHSLSALGSWSEGQHPRTPSRFIGSFGQLGHDSGRWENRKTERSEPLFPPGQVAGGMWLYSSGKGHRYSPTSVSSTGFHPCLFRPRLCHCPLLTFLKGIQVFTNNPFI